MSFQFTDMMDFLFMSGHGSYVWSSYAITLLALGLLVVIPRWQKKQLFVQLKRQQRLDAQIQSNQNRNKSQ